VSNIFGRNNFTELTMRRIAPWFLVVCFMTSMPANAGLLPERVEKAAQERIAAGTYQTLVFGVVDGDKSEVVVFGKLDNDKAPDGDTVYEIGSLTKTFTAAILAQAVLSGRVTLDTLVAQLLPDFKIPSRDSKEITLGDLGTQHSGLPLLPSNMLPKDLANPYADYDAAKLKAFLARYKLPRDPGAAARHSWDRAYMLSSYGVVTRHTALHLARRAVYFCHLYLNLGSFFDFAFDAARSRA
jgi:serine-type D-Ala-D-Ala carboxypeptidase/endopeptidase